MRIVWLTGLLLACAGDSGTDSDTDTDPDPVALGDVVINELLASNDAANVDENGDFDDWFELYNRGDDDADVSGWQVTDDFGRDVPYPLPDGTTIPAGGYLLIWADDEIGQGPLHVNFKLGASGETLTLLGPDGDLVDEITFGEQTPDISYGRSPDGSDSWDTFDPPTPEAANP